MITKSTIKQVASLRQQKFRKELGLFTVEGRKMVSELLESHFETICLFATEAYCSENKISDSRLETVTEVQMQQMSGLDTPPGILAVAKIPKQNKALTEGDFILALDGISNPGNMGTIIRTAEWFGISGIICSSDCVEIWNPKVIQATMGSVFRMRIREASLPEYLEQAKEAGKVIYGALLQGENLFQLEKKKGGIIVIGSESHGIRSEVLPFITRPITIPRADGSATESLNASIAAAIIMAEMTK